MRGSLTLVLGGCLLAACAAKTEPGSSYGPSGVELGPDEDAGSGATSTGSGGTGNGSGATAGSGGASSSSGGTGNGSGATAGSGGASSSSGGTGNGSGATAGAGGASLSSGGTGGGGQGGSAGAAPPRDPEAPADLLLLLDREQPPDFYDELARGIDDFLVDPATGGTRVALRTYGVTPGDVCDVSAYAQPDVPFGEAMDNAPNVAAAISAIGPAATGNSYPAPALLGAYDFARPWAMNNADRNVAVVMIGRDQDTFCSTDVDFQDRFAETIIATPSVPLFGIEIRSSPGAEPTGFSYTWLLGETSGAGISWRPDPTTETIRGEIASILAEVRQLAESGLEPDTSFFQNPDPPPPGTSLPVDPCKDIIRDGNLTSECLASRFENSCVGDLDGELASCLTMVSGCTPEGLAYVGYYQRGCGVEAFVTKTCEGGAAGGSLMQPDPDYTGPGGSIGYLCECDPQTGQAKGARIVVNGRTCGVKPPAP